MSMEDLLKELQGKESEKDQNHITLDMLFNAAFMSKYSSSSSFEEFVTKGNFDVKTQEDVSNIPDELFDRHVARETKFDNWQSMLDQANREFEANK